MKKMNKKVAGAVFTACAVFSSFAATAANPASYLHEDAEIVMGIDVKSIAASPILLANGIDLNAYFQAAKLESDDIPFSSLPDACYIAVSNINDAIELGGVEALNADSFKPSISFVITGNEELIDELKTDILIDDETVVENFSGLEAYSATVDFQGSDVTAYAAQIDANTFLFGINLSEDAFIDAAAGGNTNSLTKENFDGNMLVMTASMEDAEPALDGVFKVYETANDIQIQAITAFEDEINAIALEQQLQEFLPVIPATLAGMNAVGAVEAASKISVVRNGSVITITVPEANVIAQNIIPIIIMGMAMDSDIDWDDEDIDWDDEDIDWDDEDIDWE